MTQEDKNLLFKDLSARLSYHVRLKVRLKDGTTEEGFLDLEHNYGDVLRDAFYYNEIIDIKPYLFPLSSMTEEQKIFLKQQNLCIAISTSGTVETTIEGIDWLNKNHFDYRGLISMGLAIDASGLNIY